MMSTFVKIEAFGRCFKGICADPMRNSSSRIGPFFKTVHDSLSPPFLRFSVGFIRGRQALSELH